VSVVVNVWRRGLLTSNQRHHWAVRSRLTRELRALSRYRHRDHPRYQRAALGILVNFPDRRRRDVTNLAPTFKALIDGAIDAGILPDDDDTHLTATTYRTGDPHGTAGIVRITLEWSPA